MQLRDTFKNWAKAAAAFGIIFGLLGTLSWALTIPQLYVLRAVPATAFVLCGVALALACRQSRVDHWLGRIAALSVFIACTGSVIGQQAGSSSSGILADNPYQAFIAAIFGAMSLYDIIGFALLSASLVLVDLRRPNSWLCPSEWFAGCGFIMAIMAAIGTLFEQSRFCLFVSCQDMSLLAVAAYGLMCAGALLVRTDSGLMKVMESPGAGGMAARRILPGALFIPIVLGLVRVVSVKYHLSDAETTLPIAIILMMVAFVALIWSSSLKLEKKDAQLNEAMRTLEQSEQRVRTIINESVDAFVAIKQNGTICEWSHRAETMFGVSRDTAKGTQLGQFLTAKLEQEMVQFFATANCETTIQLGESQQTDYLAHADVECFDGLTKNIEAMVFLIRANDELLCCAFLRDVTLRKQLEQRFQDFYHAVSHELRSPLTAIRCSLENVHDNHTASLEPEAKNLLTNAIGASDRLIQLINDLLDLRRIEVGKFSLASVAADPILLGQAAVDTLTPLANLKSLDIILVAESMQSVTCDPARTEQVLINLISNAVKFAPAKSKIIVRVEDTDERVRFSVQDEGPGIPENQASRLFESFEQLQSPGWEYIPGTGLGLAISRRIVEELGGSIGHYNSKPTGSVFWFELLAQDTAAPHMVTSGVSGERGDAIDSAGAAPVLPTEV